VALLSLTLGHLHSPWAVAAVLLADYLPSIALGAWLGSLADRYSKRRLLVLASLLQAGAYGGLAVSHTAFPILALAPALRWSVLPFAPPCRCWLGRRAKLPLRCTTRCVGSV
jgi:MFS family permease